MRSRGSDRPGLANPAKLTGEAAGAPEDRRRAFCSGTRPLDVTLDRLAGVLPGIGTARHYRREWLGPDLNAGLAVTALLIPAGMGYAEASGLPPAAGLYATIVPLLTYALVGPSRILVLGPDSALAPIIAASILPLAGGDADRAVALAGLLAILTGATLVIGAVTRLGFVTDLLSKPIRVGYLNGIALVVIVGQLPKLLGFATNGDSLTHGLQLTAQGLADGLTDPQALAIGTAALVLLVAVKATHSRFPGLLVAVAGSMVFAAVFGWADQVPVVGALPRGLPSPALGGLQWSDVSSMIGPALGTALIAFTDTAVLSRSLAARRGESVDDNQEMAAVGISCAAAGMFGGFPACGSSTRTPVAEQAGAKTQLVGVVGAVLIMAFMVFAPGVTAYLPSSTLAAVVIVAASSLMDIPAVIALLRADRIEGLLSLAAFGGVALVGVLEGILVAIALSFVAFVINAWRPYRTELVRVEGLRGYHDVTRHPEGDRIPNVAIVRFDAPLFFANAHLLERLARQTVAGSHIDSLILAAEPITTIDATAVEKLVNLDDYLRSKGVRLLFAELKGPVKDQLQRYGLDSRFDHSRFYPTVGAAVDDLTGTLRYDFDIEPDEPEGPPDPSEPPSG
ncbi:MAG: SulP family inorganic anion transporter [Microthrixaceae bacterium]|nr:SulP family inorganic anion transporter [Microthrixaceae bacterium]